MKPGTKCPLIALVAGLFCVVFFFAASEYVTLRYGPGDAASEPFLIVVLLSVILTAISTVFSIVTLVRNGRSPLAWIACLFCCLGVAAAGYYLSLFKR